MRERQPICDHDIPRTRPLFPWRGCCGLFVASFALFAATANRQEQWQDSGRLLWQVVAGEGVASPVRSVPLPGEQWRPPAVRGSPTAETAVAHGAPRRGDTVPLQGVGARGLALSHPLHYWLGRFVLSLDLLEPSYALTLISALAAAFAVANVYGCVWTLTGHRTAALLAGASLGLAHTFWQLATLCEVQTLTAALLSGECWCLAVYASKQRPRFLWGALLCNGLSLANHMQGLLTTPVLVIVLVRAMYRREVRLRPILIASAAWLLGSLPYTGLVVVEMVRSGDVTGTIHSALFGNSYASQVLNTTLTMRMMLISAAFVALNFPNLLLPSALYGLIRADRLQVPALVRWCFGVALFIHACFAFRYDVVDRHTFFLPTYVLLTIFGGIGFAILLRSRAKRIVLPAVILMLVFTPVFYAFVPTVARKFNVLRGVVHHKPYRDDYVYLFTPWSCGDHSAARMSRAAVTLADPGGVILVEDGMAQYAIRYRALRSGARGVDIVSDITAEQIRQAVESKRPVVLVPLDVNRPRTIPPIGSWKRVGDLYRLNVSSPTP